MSDRTIIDEKTPHLNLPLPVRGNQLMDDVGRIRESFSILDLATASAAQTAADAERFAEEARATARAANDTAEDARAIAASKATTEDVAASLAAIQPTLDKVDTEGGVTGAISAAVTAYSGSIEPTLDKVNTDGTVSEAIAAALFESFGMSGKVLFSRLTAGSGNWVATDENGDGSAYAVQLIFKAAGGGANGYAPNGLVAGAPLSGGGEGELVILQHVVTPGETIAFVVGAGVSGGNGGTSSCLGYTAEGGKVTSKSTIISPGEGGGQSSINGGVIRIAGQRGFSGTMQANNPSWWVTGGPGGGKYGGIGAGGLVSSTSVYPPQRGTNGVLGCGGGFDMYMANSTGTPIPTKGGDGYIVIRKV